MHARERNTASNWLAFGIGLLLLATIAAVGIHMMRRPKPSISKVIIGTKDEVYYSRGATMQDATVLGHALQDTGFFGDRGTSVMLSKNTGGPVVSFVLNKDAWDKEGTDATFEEIGRRIATSIGGFPIQVHLVDSEWAVRKSLLVGKTMIGARDTIYYFGSATDGDAKALGQALREAGYLQDLGVSVVVSKGGRTAIGFVVGDGVWERADAVASFGRLARQVAASVGGLPVQVRLLNAEMETKKEITVQ
jgi:hypothetical protein